MLCPLYGYQFTSACFLLRYYKHKKAPLAADERKKQRKQRRDATYGLDGEEEEDIVEDQQETGAISVDFDCDLDNVEGIESLKKRLHDKIEAMQSGRNLPKNDKKERRDKDKTSAGQEGDSDDEEGQGVGSDMSLEEGDSDDDISDDMSVEESEEEEDSDQDLVDDVGDIEFSGIIAGRKDPSSEPMVRNKPGSKMKKLKKLVEESKRKRQRLDDLKAQGASGKDRANAEAWNDVIKEAAGEKVLSNTKRLQKAIKIREKKKEKSAAAWQHRVENVAADKTARIQKREANIKHRQLGITPAPAPTEVAAGETKTGAAAHTRQERAAFAKKLANKKDSKDSKDNGKGKGGNAGSKHKGDKKK